MNEARLTCLEPGDGLVGPLRRVLCRDGGDRFAILARHLADLWLLFEWKLSRIFFVSETLIGQQIILGIYTVYSFLLDLSTRQVAVCWPKKAPTARGDGRFRPEHVT